MDIVYVGTFPACDMCAQAGVSTPAAYDAATIFGPWANMCPGCMQRFGVGLGTGRGQRLLPLADKPADDAPADTPATWPQVIGGATVWACCVSAIGPACEHRREPEPDDDYYDDEDDEGPECEGHMSLRGDAMGVSVYCDGSCRTGVRRPRRPVEEP